MSKKETALRERPEETKGSDLLDGNAYCQWSTSDGTSFFPARPTVGVLPPGIYDIHSTPSAGIFFQKFNVDLEGLVRFPDASSDAVIEEIKRFWKAKEVYNTHDLFYKRGILLWGPPGSGKSCAIKLIMRDVILMGGIVINFTSPDLFLTGVRSFRKVQPDTPVVVLMEDIDSIIEDYSESSVLNFLDGVNSIEHVVYVATTNYPEKLSARMINRPSRFDRRVKIGLPNEAARGLYLQHLMMGNTEGVDLDRWIKDSEGFSLAHLKELFVSTRVLGYDYEQSLELLREMKEKVSSDNYAESKFGFETHGSIKCVEV